MTVSGLVHHASSANFVLYFFLMQGFCDGETQPCNHVSKPEIVDFVIVSPLHHLNGESDNKSSQTMKFRSSRPNFQTKPRCVPFPTSESLPFCPVKNPHFSQPDPGERPVQRDEQLRQLQLLPPQGELRGEWQQPNLRRGGAGGGGSWG